MGFNMTTLFPYIVCNLWLASVKPCSSRFSKILPHPNCSVESSFVLVASIPHSSYFPLPVGNALQSRDTAQNPGPLLFHCTACPLPGAQYYGLILLERRLLKLFWKSRMGISDSDSFKYEFFQLHTILVLWMGLRFQI